MTICCQTNLCRRVLLVVCMLFLCGEVCTAAEAPAKTLSVVGNNGAVAKFKVTVIAKHDFLSLRQIAAFYRLNFSGRKGTGKEFLCTLKNAAVRVDFSTQSPLFKINGIHASLSYKIEYLNGDFYMETSDFTQFLDPLMRPKTIPRRMIQTVMIDAGHGGNDHGTEKDGVLEKNLNLLMSRRVGAILTKRGYRVIYTRTSDVALNLEARSRCAANFSPSLFLSLHCNSADGQVSGIECFIANPAGTPSFGGGTIGKDCPSTKYNATNALWAYYTQRALLKATGAVDRGVKRKQFHVIRESPAPSMLVEIGFLSNDAERTKMISSDYQDRIAGAICAGIDRLKLALAAPVPQGKGKKK